MSAAGPHSDQGRNAAQRKPVALCNKIGRLGPPAGWLTTFFLWQFDPIFSHSAKAPRKNVESTQVEKYYTNAFFFIWRLIFQ